VRVCNAASTGSPGLERRCSFALFGALLLACSTSPAVSPAPRGGAGDGGALGDGGTFNAADGMLSSAIDAARPIADGGSPSTCGDGAARWSDPGAVPPAPDPGLSGALHHFYAIKVLDETHAPVVGATLTTTNHIVYKTDNHGAVAFYEPGLMGTDVWFTPSCPGYTAAVDGFGNAGAALHPTEAGSGTLAMTRSGTINAPDAGDLQTRLLAGPVPGPADCFALRFVDGANMRGVPLVKVVPGAADAQWSDSQGMVAVCNPDVVGRSTLFTVTSDGYALPSGSTVTLATTKGSAATIALTRRYAGERLYRVTGQGIYRDSVLLGLTTPTDAPNINGLVMGQDTPSTFVYGGKLYWLWQDTDRAAYPLGNFDTSGATSFLPDAGGLSPDLGANAAYFVDANGFSRGMVDTSRDPMTASASAAGIWLGQIVNVVDATGASQVFGTYYANTSHPWSALAKLDPSRETFAFVADYPAGAPIPGGRSMVVRDPTGTSYAYWTNPLRFPATVDGVQGLAGYEVYSAYGPHGSTTLAKNADGTLNYAWTPGATAVTQAALKPLGIDPAQGLDGHLTDLDGGSAVAVAHQVSIWNDYRKRFSSVVQQQFGTSLLGEIWYVEGDTPLGPWVYARKVVTHDDGYTFYNPDILPFSEAGGRILFFDATYTASYTSLAPTPRYNYNELMYRLDLDDPRLRLPVAIYDRGSPSAQDLVDKRGLRRGDPALAAVFFALDRPAPETVPVSWNGPACAARQLVTSAGGASSPLFYAMPASAPSAPGTTSLYDYTGPTGAHVYSVASSLSQLGFKRGDAIARVWISPLAVPLAVADFLGDLVADAGPDQCSTTQPITLDATASRDLAGPITSYSWTDEAKGCEIATGVTAMVSLTPGPHAIQLRTTDALANVSTDEVFVTVAR
jgi:hypothetical protein